MSRLLVAFGVGAMLMTCTALGDDTVTKINSITPKKTAITPRGEEEPVLLVCYSLQTGVDSDEIKITTLGIGRKIDESNPINVIEEVLHEVVPEDPVVGDCKYFRGQLSVTYGDHDVLFILEGHGDNFVSLVYAEATFTIPNDFLDASPVTSSQVLETDTLRLAVKGSLGSWKICQEDGKTVAPSCDDPPTKCYAIEIGAITAYSLCIKDEASGAIYNREQLTADPLTASQEDDPDQVILTYDVAQPTLTVKSTKITDGIEVVLYKDSDTVYTLCDGTKDQVEAETGLVCTLESFVKSTDEMKNIIVNVKSGAATKSKRIPFKDYNIQHAVLGTKIIEMYWLRDVVKYYGAHIDKAGVPAQYASIDCHTDEPDGSTYCFVYFVELDLETYTVTVTPAKNEDVENLELTQTNQIVADPISLSEKQNQQKRIIGITMLNHPSQNYGVLQICYKPLDSVHNETRDEAIIIDEDGHWIKIHQSTQGEDLVNCFSPVDFLKTSLRITQNTKLSAVIVERELNGYQILASGQADIDLSALRVSKPEMDDKSEGYTGTLAIVGAAIGGVACLMALVAVAVLFVMKRKRNNDGLQYPLHHSNIEGSNIIHGLDNLNSTN